MKNNQKGFSVIEILAVVAVIGLIGVIGWLAYDRYSSKSNDNISVANTEQSQSAQVANPKGDTIEDVLVALDERLSDQSVSQTVSEDARYTLESVSTDGVDIKIKENGEYVQEKTADGNSKRYRLNRVSSEFESYDEYLAGHKAAADDLVDYAISELGFAKVDTHSVDGPADTFVYHLMEKENMYCQVEHATGVFISIGCIEQ